MICPKCGFEQPDGLECMRCGIIVSRYKGSMLGTTPVIPPAPPSPRPAPFPSVPPPPAPVESMGSLYGDPDPALAMAGGGTLYAGPLPAATGVGGTVYGGPGSAPAATRRSGLVKKLEVGKVLSETFSIYFSNFIAFALLTGLALSPLYLLQAYLTSITGSVEAAKAADGMSLILVGLSAFLCPYIATAAITYGVFQQMRGRDTSIGDCLSRGLSCLIPVLLLAIVQGLAILFGFALCIVPGILWALKWAVSVPAAVEEDAGIGTAMERSAYLTEGYRGDIFGVLFVINFLSSGITLVLELAFAKDAALLLLISGVKDMVFVGLSATATAVMYYRLRSIKESIDVDQISSVFA